MAKPVPRKSARSQRSDGVPAQLASTQQNRHDVRGVDGDGNDRRSPRLAKDVVADGAPQSARAVLPRDLLALAVSPARVGNRHLEDPTASARDSGRHFGLEAESHVALEPPYVRLTPRHGGGGSADGPGAGRLEDFEHGCPVQSPRLGTPPGGRGAAGDSDRTGKQPESWNRTGGRGTRWCIVNTRHSGHGGLASTGKAVDLKSTGPRGPWGFESLALRQLTGHPQVVSRLCWHGAVTVGLGFHAANFSRTICAPGS
jgi:hypothetical protein